MNETVIKIGILTTLVRYPGYLLSEAEAAQVAEYAMSAHPHALGYKRVEISASDQDGYVDVTTYPNSDIRRLRGITGYLSEVKKFNAGKLSELEDRAVHGM